MLPIAARFDRDMGSRQRQRERERRRQQRLRLGALAAVAVALVVVLAVVAFGGGGSDAAEVEVDMFDFGFRGELVAPAGPVQLSARNVGKIPHNIGIRGGPITNHVQPGRSIELDLGVLSPGTYQLYCDIADHVEAGMVAELVVTP